MFLASLLLYFPCCLSQLASSGFYNEEWLVPTDENSELYFLGGMPLGNGDLAALVWANYSAGGVSIYMSKQNAMHSDTQSYKVALLTLSLEPNPFNLGGSYFNQTLDISTATVWLSVGGSKGTPAASFSIFLDAASNTAYISAWGLSNFSYTATLTPIRPNGYSPYAAPWHCTLGSSSPDIFLDPIPSAFPSPHTLVVLHENLPTDLATGPIVNATLSSQGLGEPSIVSSVPNLWSNRRFGVAVDSMPAYGNCSSLQRVSPFSLSSLLPAACVRVRVSSLSSQEPSRDAWVHALASQVSLQPDTPPRGAHLAFWEAFWKSSYVDIKTNSTGGVFLPPAPFAWLSASSISQPNGTNVQAWGPLIQNNMKQQPVFVTDAFGTSLPGVRFSQHELQFISSENLTIPRGDLTVVAVMKDQGSDGGTANPKSVGCCSGVVSLGGSFFGISSFPSTGSGEDNDDSTGSDDPYPNGHGISLLGDFEGSRLSSNADINVAGRTVVAIVVYKGSTASLYVDGCLQGSAELPTSSPNPTTLFIGTRGADVYQRYFEGILGEAVVYDRALSLSEVRSTYSYFATTYNVTPPQHCLSNDGFMLSKTYAMSRYLNSIQSRYLDPVSSPRDQQPIKFNGLAWTSRRPGTPTACSENDPTVPNLGPDCRQWCVNQSRYR